MDNQMLVWNMVLTGVVGIMGFLLKGKFDELERFGILLNKTREEVARDMVTRVENERLLNRVEGSILRLEDKIDELRKGIIFEQ